MQLSLKGKIDIVHKISSEDDFREDVLLPIFRSMPTVIDVRVTHGATERGKDIVLVEKDSLGDYYYTAVIIKNKTITNATTPKPDRESISTVINQVSSQLTLATIVNM